MKSLLFTLSLSLFTFAFAQEAELPKEKGAKKSSYYHDDTPLNAFHSIYSDLYIHRWLDAPHDGMEPIPQAEQDRISDIFLKDSFEKKNYPEYLKGLLYREKWDEVIARLPEILKYYESMPKMKSMDLANYGSCYMAWPQALMGAGRKAEAKAKLEEIKAKNIGWAGYYKGGRKAYPHAPRDIPFFLHWFDEGRLDALQLPRWSEGVAFPEPQVATYQDKYAKAETIDLYLDGVDVRDARVKLLALKLKRRGFKLNGGNGRGRGYRLAIALDGTCKVDRPEGYTLEATAKGCEIRARDKQGVLWGIVSFLQILDPEKKRMRQCAIEDWPACPKRGFLGRRWTGTAEFAIFNKMNYVTIKPHILHHSEFYPLNLFEASSQGTEFKDFGLLVIYCAFP